MKKTMVVMFALMSNLAHAQEGDFKTKSVTSFSDGTSIEVKVYSYSGTTVEKTTQMFQIKQANGIVCYGLAEWLSGTIGNPTIACIK